jgi:BirA family transcriptional regulator, biotin operon repressor / biotin---[acetyl-CoA-carboxylase] ligase
MTRRQQEAALLGALFDAPEEWIDLETLARRAALAPWEVAPALASYGEAGYPVEFHPQGRVRLNAPPDIWCAEEILGRCPVGDGGLVWDPLLLAETTSTNDVARQQAGRGARAGFVVAAARQTRGRGRLGRTWDSPRDAGLYVSILLRPDLALRHAGALTTVGSVAMADAVEAAAGFRPQIKWPNDLMVGRCKLGGLLIETEPSGARLAWAVVGIGINVNHGSGDFSPEVREIATSIRTVSGGPHRRADVLVSLLNALTRRLSEPFEQARRAWVASSLTLGQRVTLTTLRGTRHGQAVGLDPSGALLLRGESGEVEVITAGDMQAC